MVKYRAVAVAVAVAVSGGGAVAVAVAGLTKRFLNHIQKDFLINVWGYVRRHTWAYQKRRRTIVVTDHRYLRTIVRGQQL